MSPAVPREEIALVMYVYLVICIYFSVFHHSRIGGGGGVEVST